MSLGHLERADVRDARALVDAARQRMERIEPDSAWLRQTRAFSISKAIRELMQERLTGVEAECTAELRRQRPADALTLGNTAIVPLQTLPYRALADTFTRDALAGVSTAGGYVVASLNWPSAAQALISARVLGRLGILAFEASGANLNLPLVTAATQPVWLGAEEAAIPESDITLGQLGLSPHTVGGYVQLSRPSVIQTSPAAEAVIANDLWRMTYRTVEAGAFAGSGVAGQPRGLIGRSGVNTESGASFTIATAITAATATADAYAADTASGWAANRTVAGLLRQRYENSGSIPLWRGGLPWGTLADEPAGSTTAIPSGTAIFGNWAYYVLVTWGGLELSINPYAAFPQGIIGMRAMLTLDVAPIWASAFTVVSSVT